MRRHVQWWLCAVALTVLGTASQAQARDYDRYDPTRIYGGLWLGFGGDIEYAGRDVGDLGKTIGGQGGVDVRVGRWLSLGGEVRVGGFDVGQFDDRNRLIDLDFKPRLYLPLHAPVEIYSDVDGRGQDENIGWNVGVGPGLNVFLTDRFGLNVEPMWLFHHFGVDGTDGDGKVTVKQFAVLLNAVLAI